MVRETPDTGVVVLPNNSNQWPTYYRNRAEFLMHQKCPAGYVIDGEEEAVDNPAARDGRKPQEHFDYNGAYQRITTFDRKVYRIRFHRTGADSAVPPPSPPKKATPVGETLPPVEEAPPPRRLLAEK